MNSHFKPLVVYKSKYSGPQFKHTGKVGSFICNVNECDLYLETYSTGEYIVRRFGNQANDFDMEKVDQIIKNTDRLLKEKKPEYLYVKEFLVKGE